MNPFNLFSTESQSLQYFQNFNTYIPPIEITVDEKLVYKIKNDNMSLTVDVLHVQIVPLRKVFIKFFDLPHIFEDISLSRRLSN